MSVGLALALEENTLGPTIFQEILTIRYLIFHHLVNFNALICNFYAPVYGGNGRNKYWHYLAIKKYRNICA